MPVERIYIAHIKGCNINLKKYGAPSYRQVKLFPQADNYRLGVSKSYQPLSTLSPCVETGSRYIVDIFYCSHFLDCTLDIALCSPLLTAAIVLHSGMAMDRSYQRTHMKTHSQILEGMGIRKGDGKQNIQHTAPLFVKLVNFNTPLKYYSLGPCFGGSRAGWGSPGQQEPPQRHQ